LRYSTLYMDTPQKTIYVDIPLSPIIAEVAMKTPIIDPLPSATLLLIIRNTLLSSFKKQKNKLV